MESNYNSSDRTDCIYYQDQDEDLPNRKCCIHKSGLYRFEESMCHNCRLWDSYIPNNASEDEKEKAIGWQDMPYGEQPDYDEYF